MGIKCAEIKISIGQIAEAVGGELHGGGGRLSVRGISTDSRSLEPGQLFVALRGEEFDGHDFVDNAFASGAAAAIVETAQVEQFAAGLLITVDDTLLAYGKLAAWYRRQLDVAVVAVTGSVGKTTTKNMIGSILSRRGRTQVAPGNWNNEVGVPRVLLSLTEDYDYCVLELAMRGRGEIGYLTEIAAPQVGLITNVGETHLGRLGSCEAIAEAKAELLEALPTEGIAVLNADDFYYGLLSELSPCPVVSFGCSPQADVRAKDVQLHNLQGAQFTLEIAGESQSVRIVHPGMHNVMNAAAAATACWAVTGSTGEIAAGLAACPIEAMRSEVHCTSQGATVINDAYNAAPRSVKAALDLLAQLLGRKIFVFGDMLELGEAAEQEHRRVGRLCAEKGIQWLVSVGQLAALAAEEAASAGVRADMVEDAAEAIALIRPQLSAGDVVLVKASRELGLEQVVEGVISDD